MKTNLGPAPGVVAKTHAAARARKPGAAILSIALALVLAPLPALADGGARPGTGGDAPGPFRARLDNLRTVVNESNDPLEHVGTGFSGWLAWMEANRALSDLDEALDAGMTEDDEGPQVPSSCAAAEDASCGPCFEAAYGRVNFVRMTLERLRSIHTRTINYIKAKESFGDTVAPVHGMSGLAWQASRAEIEASRAQFNANSVAKYEQLVDTMRAALGDVAQCEREHFDNPDWDSRYGFMYLQSIRTAYRPGDS